MKSIAALLIVISLIGCASTKKDYIFDGSTEASTKAGIERVMKRLNEDEKVEFLMALLAVQFSNVKSVYELIGNQEMMKTNYSLIGEKIDGLNYYQVIELSKQSPTKVQRVNAN